MAAFMLPDITLQTRMTQIGTTQTETMGAGASAAHRAQERR
mgnify:CR=1 FL=1